ncbi:hypothetical protein PS467_32200 [Streptomyces luomodiensis]|uniref:Uncharacterized protein n=1 Tax=Streptomyces luomodiensis TaxID=3026192 RepID=A0ABY9V460_9ACTN|nr:hypothetical protein [Streptomyces sp. SCA4-21]WNE99662.1 hypothetical protein PS467_32200 [Streptomyces sp. SCA4-21]
MLLVSGAGARTDREKVLDAGEDVIVDQRSVDDLLRDDPLVLAVRAHGGGVAEGDVVDIEQCFVFVLPVPDLTAGVAGIAEDRADGAFGPCTSVAMGVAGPVVGGGAGDAVAGQALGDGEDAVAAEELGEDSGHDRGGVRVRFEAVQTFAVGCLAGIGVMAEVAEPVSVRGPAAEVAALHQGLGGHCGVHADFDAVALALRHAAEDRHDQVVGLVVRIDGTADFRYPQRHAVVDEEWEGVAELAAVEGSLGLTDASAKRVRVSSGQGAPLQLILPAAVNRM